MSVDWVTVAVGVLFVLNRGGYLTRCETSATRVAERGGDVERFERFRQGKLMRAAPPVCLVLGILLVITGLLT